MAGRNASLLFPLLLLAACPLSAGADATLSPTESVDAAALHGGLQVWGWNIAAASLNKLVPAFNARFPHVAVNVNMTGANLQSRFLLSLSAGVGAPDISQLQLAEAQRYAVTRRLTDLTPVAQCYAAAFPASFWENCVFEGHIYAIPWDMGPCAVFYKRSLLAQYAIDPDSIFTWDDFVAAGKRLLEASGGTTKMMVLPTGGMEFTFEMLLQQLGGQVFDAQGRVAIRSPQALQVLGLLRKFIQTGITANVPPYSHAHYASIRSPIVATFPSAAWWGGTIKDYAPEMSGDWGVFRLPAFTPGGLRTSNQGGSVLVIPDQCAQKQAAWAYIEYALCTREAQIGQYRNFDLFPAFLPAHEDPFFDEPDPYFGGQNVRRLFAQDIERIPPLNRTKDWFEAMRYVSQALSTWVDGDMNDADPFLRTLEHRLATRLGREIAPGVEAP
ncbi:MAG: extracellular solute-binding protein [Candidatus Hydrogenedentes bacterium]|nr:extracellular solute-binding protein [Candidatus Hydrogenedentota bacterium]